MISPSAPIIAVISSSSFMSAFPRIALIARFADFIMASCTPPKCGASGGLKCHFTPLFAADSVILSSSICETNKGRSHMRPPMDFHLVLHGEYL